MKKKDAAGVLRGLRIRGRAGGGKTKVGWKGGFLAITGRKKPSRPEGAPGRKVGVRNSILDKKGEKNDRGRVKRGDVAGQWQVNWLEELQKIQGRGTQKVTGKYAKRERYVRGEKRRRITRWLGPGYFKARRSTSLN